MSYISYDWWVVGRTSGAVTLQLSMPPTRWLDFHPLLCRLVTPLFRFRLILLVYISRFHWNICKSTKFHSWFVNKKVSPAPVCPVCPGMSCPVCGSWTPGCLFSAPAVSMLSPISWSLKCAVCPLQTPSGCVVSTTKRNHLAVVSVQL